MFADWCKGSPGLFCFCSLKEPPLLTGVLEPNSKLQKAERLWENQLVGPESIVNIGGKHWQKLLSRRTFYFPSAVSSNELVEYLYMYFPQQESTPSSFLRWQFCYLVLSVSSETVQETSLLVTTELWVKWTTWLGVKFVWIKVEVLYPLRSIISRLRS